MGSEHWAVVRLIFHVRKLERRESTVALNVIQPEVATLKWHD